jgi:hypothetical protein
MPVSLSSMMKIILDAIATRIAQRNTVVKAQCAAGHVDKCNASCSAIYRSVHFTERNARTLV